MPPLTGRVVAGRYNLQTAIGRGAMGVVWRAHDRLLDREVAVKEVVMSALIGADERRNAYQRTLREARTAARLSHHGVVAIYDVVEEDGRPWIIMELVPSQSLDQVLVVDGRLPTARAGRIGQQLLSALAAAHLAGVLHRDVKPSNVLIATNRSGNGWDERAVLTDFGIAQFEGDPRLTQTGMVMGSPGFTAPERIRGSAATPASDLWSLGATMYAAVEGRGPYENRGGAITTMSAIINDDAPLAPHAGPLAPVIAALLRRDPLARPSASLATRMFAQALPKLAETVEDPRVIARPPTIRSSYVPRPGAPAASAPVTTPDNARPEKKQPPTAKPAAMPAARPAAKEEPARDEKEHQAEETTVAQMPAVEEPALQQAPEQASAEVAGQADAGETAAASDTNTDTDTAESTPEPESVSVAAAIAEDTPAAEGKPDPEAEAEANNETEPAAETAEFTASSPESAAAAVPGPSPVEAHGAAAKAADSALTDPGSDNDGAGLRAATTVVPRKGADITVSRQEADTVVPRKGADTAIPRIKPEPLKPTFTAAKPKDRPVASSFSAASPARSAPPGRPTPPRAAAVGNLVLPPSSQRPAYEAFSPSKGRATPFRPQGAQYAPQGGQEGQGRQDGQPGQPGLGTQYAGPSQASPDLSRQYPPGSGGGQGKRASHGLGRKARWTMVAVAVAAVVGVGVGVGVGTAFGLSHGSSPGTRPSTLPSVADTATGFKSIDALNNPSSALPGPNWTTQTVTQADAQSDAAGFSIDMPPGWTETRNGLETDFNGPGDVLLEVDLTPQSTSDMLTAATQVSNASISRFTGYRQQDLKAVPVRHTEGAVWSFTWTPAGGVQDTVDDIFFAQSAPGGVQDYAIYLRSPSNTFGTSTLPLFSTMLRTFQVVP